MSFSAPTSEVAICNLALSHLKQKPIAQLDPPSSQVETLCANWYHQIRQQTLRCHPWNFASTRIKILPSSTAPVFGFSHQYLLPADWVRYLGRYDDLGNRIIGCDSDYELEGRYYLMNGEDNVGINLRYVTDFQTVSKMDALFRGLFAVELAIVLAPNFSGGEGRVTTLIGLRKDMKAEATAIDGQERPPRRVQTSKFIDARRAGTGRVAGPYTKFSG